MHLPWFHARVNFLLSLLNLVCGRQILDETPNNLYHSNAHEVCLKNAQQLMPTRSQKDKRTSLSTWSRRRLICFRTTFGHISPRWIKNLPYVRGPLVSTAGNVFWEISLGEESKGFNIKPLTEKSHTAESHHLLQKHQILCPVNPVSRPLAQRGVQNTGETAEERSGMQMHA